MPLTLLQRGVLSNGLWRWDPSSRKSDRFNFPVFKVQINKPWIHFREVIGLDRLLFLVFVLFIIIITALLSQDQDGYHII